MEGRGDNATCHIRQTRKASIGLASGVCLGECQWPDGDGNQIPGAAE